MNSLDPSLAKYLSKSKQDIYEQYHGGSSSGKKKKKSKHASFSHETGGTGLIIADDGDDVANPWNASSSKMMLDGDEDDDRQPGELHCLFTAHRACLLIS